MVLVLPENIHPESGIVQDIGVHMKQESWEVDRLVVQLLEETLS